MSVSLPDGSALAEQIAAARWYGGKGAAIETVTEQDRLELPGGAALHVLAVRSQNRADERYLYLTGEERIGEPLVQAIAAGGDHGDWSFRPGMVLPGLLPADLSQRPIGADQSNTTVVVGERLALKMYRRLEPGRHPDIEIGQYLTEQASVAFVPAYAGAVRWRGHAIAMLQAYVSNAEDGWEWGAAAVQAGEVGDIARLGANSRTLHGALAQLESRPATAAEQHDVAAVGGRTARPGAGAGGRGHARRAAGLRAAAARGVRGRRAGPAAAAHAGARRLPHRSDPALRATACGWSTSRASRPSRLAERNGLGTPLRDVAAMLRSFDHLARHVDRDLMPGHPRQIEAWIVERTGGLPGRPTATTIRGCCARSRWRRRPTSSSTPPRSCPNGRTRRWAGCDG